MHSLPVAVQLKRGRARILTPISLILKSVWTMLPIPASSESNWSTLEHGIEAVGREVIEASLYVTCKVGDYWALVHTQRGYLMLSYTYQKLLVGFLTTS